MTSGRTDDIRLAVGVAEKDGRLQRYYASAPGDCGIRHHVTVTACDGYRYELVCNTRAMWILAQAILDNEPITPRLISALRYVR